jgi:hypothetical protein
MILRLSNIVETILAPALQLLPGHLDCDRARVMLLAIGLQESGFSARRQVNGPARGFWQTEPNGVRAAWANHQTMEPLRLLCRALDVSFDPQAIYPALETNDQLAAGVARLLLFADPHPLPELDDCDGAWGLYLRCWRPGKPRPDDWPANHAAALAEVRSETPA